MICLLKEDLIDVTCLDCSFTNPNPPPTPTSGEPTPYFTEIKNKIEIKEILVRTGKSGKRPKILHVLVTDQKI